MIHLPRLLAEALVRFDSLELRTRRLTAEALTVYDGLDLRTRRVVAEAIGTLGLDALALGLEANRSTLEVIGLAAAATTALSTVSRTTAEALAPATAVHPGLEVSPVGVDVGTIALAFDLTGSQGPGYWAIQGQNEDGFSITWDLSLSDTLYLRWKAGNTVLDSTVEYSGGPMHTLLTLPQGSSTPYLSNLGSIRPDTNPGSLSLLELMLWNRPLSAPEQTIINDYLDCRWVLPGCNVGNLTC